MNVLKRFLKSLVPDRLWCIVRERKIIRGHAHVAAICETLLNDVVTNDISYDFSPKHKFSTDKIIWQYWAQGYDNLPNVVADCLASVDKYCSNYAIVRLDDDNITDYVDLPEWLEKKKQFMSLAHFSDILRIVLLGTYGGIWIDATIKLTDAIPLDILNMSFFVFRRDDNEPNKDYWENTYAYYFGWGKGFRVRMLSSFIVSSKGLSGLSKMKDCLLEWWAYHSYLPDYFFLQILYDAMISRGYSDLDCKMLSDTLPHYMQQSLNDPSFSVKDANKVLESFPIHKLTYKKEC